MRINQTLTQSIAATLLACALYANAPVVERLIEFGDSWAVGSFLGLEKSFAANAPDNTVVPAALPGETASMMNSTDPAHGLPNIASTIAAHPAVDIIHLNIGGNDILLNWTSVVAPTAEDVLLTSIVDNNEAVVLHVLAQRPDLEVFYSSYDYFRPLPGRATPLQ